MRIYKLKAFARFQRRQRIADDALTIAVRDAAAGLVDANLGGGLIKQRVARSGAGKSGGFRVLVAYRRGHRAVFLYGFAKSARSNLDADELAALKGRAAGLLNAQEQALDAMIAVDELVEVEDVEED
jgi:hypothetical protein